MKTGPSDEAIAEFKKQEVHVHLMYFARLLWDRVLRDSERKKLGTSFEVAVVAHHGTTGLWMALHPTLSVEQSVLDVSRAVGSIDQLTYEWLIREIVGARVRIGPGIRPERNHGRGELKFHGDVIRRVRISVGNQIVKILDEFERQGWPERIDSPITDFFDDMKHRDAIRRLNSDLAVIRFRSDGTGRGILWEICPPPTVSSTHRCENPSRSPNRAGVRSRPNGFSTLRLMPIDRTSHFCARPVVVRGKGSAWRGMMSTSVGA